MTITYYNNVSSKPQGNTEIISVLNKIKRGKNLKELIKNLRGIEDSDEKSNFKKYKLPCVTFSGVFADHRRYENFQQHSGCLVVDLDHVSNLLVLKAEFVRDPYVFFCFTSPSGDGLKVGFKIPKSNRYEQYDRFAALRSYLLHKYSKLLEEESFDDSGKDLTRLCYLSYDPEIYINDDCKEYTGIVRTASAPAKKRKGGLVRREFQQNPNQKKWAALVAVKMIREMDTTKGSRHMTCFKAGRLMAGFVAGNIIESNEAQDLLDDALSSKGFNKTDYDDFKRAIDRGFNLGLEHPIQTDYTRNLTFINSHSLAKRNEKKNFVVITEFSERVSFFEPLDVPVIAVPENYVGYNFKFLNNVADYLESFDTYYLDIHSEKMRDELARRLGRVDCKMVQYDAEKNCDQLINQAIEFPISGIKRLTLEIEKYFKKALEKGKKKGTSTHYFDLDDNMLWMKGKLYSLVGPPNHGKTELLLNLCLVKSLFDGDVWAIFDPEESPEEFYDKMIQIFIGKSTDKDDPNKMNQEELVEGMKFVKKHFIYVYPDDDQSYKGINEVFAHLILKEGVTGVIVDPFNQLDDPEMYRDREAFLSLCLKDAKKFAQLYDIYYIITLHPNSNYKGTLDKDKKMKHVTFSEMNGGYMWANKCDMVISVVQSFWDRPELNETEMKLVFLKVKSRLMGKHGTVFMNYKDYRYEIYGRNPIRDIYNVAGTFSGYDDQDAKEKNGSLTVGIPTSMDIDTSDLPF